MSKHLKSKVAVFSAVTAAAALGWSGAAFAQPSSNLSFSASSDGASAGWTNGKGSPIELTLGSSQATYAAITLHHVDYSVGSLSEPTFSTDNYGPGSPRYVIWLSDGNSLWGYPSNSGLSSGSNLAWAVDNGNTYESWTDVQQSAESSATVTGAEVIADGEQAPGTVDTISGLTFGGAPLN